MGSLRTAVLSDSSGDERSPLALTVAALDGIPRPFSFAARQDGGWVPRVSSPHHQGALASFQHLQRLYNVPQQEFAFYLQLRHFLLATLQDYLLPLATDLESLFLRLKSVKGFVSERCCLFDCNNSHALRQQEKWIENRVCKMSGGKDGGWLGSLLVANTPFHI